MKHTPPVDRRQFLKSGMRYGLLTALGGLAAMGEMKRRRLENDPNCVRIWTCADCVEFGSCRKPKALDFRQAQPVTMSSIPLPRP